MKAELLSISKLLGVPQIQAYTWVFADSPHLAPVEIYTGNPDHFVKILTKN